MSEPQSSDPSASQQPAATDESGAKPEQNSSSIPTKATVKVLPTAPTTSPPRLPQAPIVYDLPAPETATAESALQSLLHTTKEKYAARAARFGSDTRRVRDVDVLGARRASVRTGFATGFDITTEEQVRRRQRRAERFGTLEERKGEERSEKDAQQLGDDTGKLMKKVQSDPLERRRDVAVGELPRWNVLHVFGVDTLSTRNLLAHFKAYGPSWVEWLNDSSANIAFEDEYTVKRVLHVMAVTAREQDVAAVAGEAPEDRMDDGEGAGTGVAVAGDGTLPEEVTWRPAEPFRKEKEGVIVPLWARLATELDRRPEMPNPRSKWSRTVRGKKREERTERDRKRVDDREEDRERASRQGRLGVRSSIEKARRKKVTRMDLDKALETQ